MYERSFTIPIHLKSLNCMLRYIEGDLRGSYPSYPESPLLFEKLFRVQFIVNLKFKVDSFQNHSKELEWFVRGSFRKHFYLDLMRDVTQISLPKKSNEKCSNKKKIIVFISTCFNSQLIISHFIIIFNFHINFFNFNFYVLCSTNYLKLCNSFFFLC